MKLLPNFLTCLVTTTAFFLANTANAVPTPLFTFTQPVTSTGGNFHIGNEFVTGQGLIVSGIGVYVGPSQITAGLTNAEYTANLYASDATTLLSSALIPIGTPVGAQNFAYVPLNTTLSPSTHYYLTSRATGSFTAFGYYSPSNSSAGTWALGSTFIRNRYSVGYGPVTTTNGSFQEFLGGNLLVDVIPVPAPEPTSLAMLGLGLAGFAAKRRKNRLRRAYH